MPSGRVLTVAGLAGLLGAVLVAVLVLGRSEPIEALTLADLDEGGVYAARLEVYQRHGPKAEQIAARIADGEIGVFPERWVDEARMLLGPGGDVLELVIVTRTPDGELFQRGRATADGTVTERPVLGVRVEAATSDDGLADFKNLPSDLPAEFKAEVAAWRANDDWSEVTAPRGWVRFELLQPVSPGEPILDGGTASVPYFSDLGAVEIVTVVAVSLERLESRDERFVVLDDGRRVLVESRRTVVEALPTSTWEPFISEVWPD